MRPVRVFIVILLGLALVCALALWSWSPTKLRENATLQPQARRAATDAIERKSMPPLTPHGSAPQPGPEPVVLPGEATAVDPADERQRAKITRGMSAAAGGGVRVDATPPGSVTGQMRLRAGDVITAVNGEAIESPDEFARMYREQGLPRQLTILREGREIHLHRD